MFQVSLLDHIRLSFGQVIYGYKAHAEIVERLTRRVWWIKIAELTLLGGTLAAAVTSAVRGGRAYVIVSAVLAGAALVLFIAYVAVNLESRIHAHRWCAARLWLIREKYRALLSEVRDGSLTLDAARERRDALLKELHAIVEHAPIVDRPAYQSARQALSTPDEAALTDEEIDRFLPKSLRKEWDENSAGAAARPSSP